MIKAMILAAAALTMVTAADAQTMIQKNDIKVENHLMTPEALWAMGRIGGAEASPNGKQVVYQVGYYSVKENKGHQMLFIMDANGKNQKALTTDAKSETDAAWIQGGQKIATTFIPEGVTDGNGGEFKNKDYYGTDYDKNFEEAKELLASIGLLDESTGQVNQTVEFSYLVNNSEANVKIGEAIQADLSKVGINLKVEQQEWNVFLNSRKDGQFDFAREGWLMDYNDPINMLEMFTTKSGNNDMQFGR